MKVQELSSGWTLQASSWEEAVSGTVPGSVYMDMLNAGRIRDPYWRENEEEALALMEDDFTYRCVFRPGPGVLGCAQRILRFEGVDTAADAVLNGSPLGRMENMHRTYEFDVTNLLLPGDNTLVVTVCSPTKYIRESLRERPVKGTEAAMAGFPNLRKAHCMFGWEWAPYLPDAGIWRPVKLLGVEGGRILDVRIDQEHRDGQVELKAVVNWTGSVKEINFTISLADPDGKAVEFPSGTNRLTVENPRLWWPRGYGDQPLYTVKVIALSEGREVDRWEGRTGLRTVTVRREKDGWGESFAHLVNGVAVFAMGAGYVPEDCILPRRSEARTRQLLEDCAAANFNLVRVWGGGHYPEDYFYDICDELGLLVWQDFMFARASYELDPAFGENIAAEVRDNVRRLRRHPCIALWCGNDGGEASAQAGLWVDTPRRKADYIRVFEYLIPKVVQECAPEAFYWPGSPSSGGGFDSPNGQDRGDVQDWGGWHGGRPFTAYRENMGRYASGFGFQSWPCLRTVEAFTEPRDRNLSSRVMDRRQRCAGGGGLLAAYLQSWFLYAPDLPTALYASQLLQAQAVRAGAEHFRRGRGRCMGAVYWQVNDCWPGPSGSSIDYTGRWKALHYFAKRFFAPVLLSCREEGLRAAGAGSGGREKKSVTFCVSNETRRTHQVQVKWALRDRFSRIKREEVIALNVPALSSAELETVELPELEAFTDYVSYELYENGRRESLSAVLFTPPKHYEYLDPELSCRLEGDQVVVKAKAFAQCVEVRNSGEDLVLEDNYFDMLPGERRVRIVRGTPNGLKIRSVYDIR